MKQEVMAAQVEFRGMFATPIIVMLSGAGVLFYLRFLFALLKDAQSGFKTLSSVLRVLGQKYAQPLRWDGGDARALLAYQELKPKPTLNDAERTIL